MRWAGSASAERTQRFLGGRLCADGGGGSDGGRLWGWGRGRELWGRGGSRGAARRSLSPAWEDRWLVLLFNSSSRLYVRPVGRAGALRKKRGQWARIGWDQDQMPAEQWGFWKKCGRKRGAGFVLPPHCRLEWGSSDLMKCIPKRGRQPGAGRQGDMSEGGLWGRRGGGSDPLMDRPEQCGLSAGWEKPSIHPCAY